MRSSQEAVMPFYPLCSRDGSSQHTQEWVRYHGMVPGQTVQLFYTNKTKNESTPEEQEHTAAQGRGPRLLRAMACKHDHDMPRPPK